MQRWYERVTEGEGGVGGALLRPPLWIASRAYAALIAARNTRYDRSAGAVRRVGVPVVSIGNITTGGTGKTPMTIHVVERLRALGRNPAVVSRGYASADGIADELALVQQAVPGVPCIANADRVAGAEKAVRAHAADVIVLDDGFQHRRIGRDLDIVLLDATAPFGGGHLLPRGRLREPVTSLRRCDAVIITRADAVDAAVLERLRAQAAELSSHRPVLACVHQPAPLRPLPGDFPADEPDAGMSVHLASGIAQPRAFERTVAALGLQIAGHTVFPDHHAYGWDDVMRIAAQARGGGAARIVVTEKDAVKLAALAANWPLPVDVLPVRIDFVGDDATIFGELLADTLARCGTAAAQPGNLPS